MWNIVGQPLRYRISDWKQASRCLSNTDKNLRINITDFTQDKNLQGLRIQVKHDKYGVVFSHIIKASGDMIVPYQTEPALVFELTTEQILKELNKFGFIIEYVDNYDIPIDQLELLMSIQKFKYDKIRILNVWDVENGTKQYKTQVVVFMSDANPNWLNAGYAASRQEFVDALNSGTAMNLTNISDVYKYRWDWLVNAVMNIEDILKEAYDK